MEARDCRVWNCDRIFYSCSGDLDVLHLSKFLHPPGLILQAGRLQIFLHQPMSRLYELSNTMLLTIEKGPLQSACAEDVDDAPRRFESLVARHHCDHGLARRLSGLGSRACQVPSQEPISQQTMSLTIISVEALQRTCWICAPPHCRPSAPCAANQLVLDQPSSPPLQHRSPLKTRSEQQ